MTDPHATEHTEWDDEYLAGALVLLGDREVVVVERCGVCGEPVPCRGESEPEPRWVRAQRAEAPRRIR